MNDMATKKTTYIRIPHLKGLIITVEKKKKDDPIGGAAYVERLCSEEYRLVLPLPIKGKVTAGHLVHEIVHILQYIVEDNIMSFIHEREHLAYIAGYIFDEVCKI